jgi:hypothetical protein
VDNNGFKYVDTPTSVHYGTTAVVPDFKMTDDEINRLIETASPDVIWLEELWAK